MSVYISCWTHSTVELNTTYIYKCTLVFSVNFGTICLYGYTGFHQEFTSVISLLRYGTVLVIHIRK